METSKEDGRNINGDLGFDFEVEAVSPVEPSSDRIVKRDLLALIEDGQPISAMDVVNCSQGD